MIHLSTKILLHILTHKLSFDTIYIIDSFTHNVTISIIDSLINFDTIFKDDSFRFYDDVTNIDLFLNYSTNGVYRIILVFWY